MNWTEIIIKVPTEYTSQAEDIANMTVPYGIFTEDYSDLEQGAMEIAHIDLIDEQLLAKDREKSLIHIYLDEYANAAEALSYLQEMLTASKIPFEIYTDKVSDTDWADNWKKFFKVTEIGKKLVILPTWEEYKGDGSRRVLSIDPGAAFGTGTHATTRLCLEMLENYAKEDSSMLDIGCGSGILSIAGLLLGAKSVVGVDIDELAVKVATENTEINGLSDKACFVKGDLAENITGKFDVICANIVADIVMMLTTDVPKYLSDGGVFMCSGIIDIRANEVENCLKENGFEIVEAKVQENWHAYAAVRQAKLS